MSNVDSPAVARRRVRLALRAARMAKHLTQSQVARAMDWSLSKVIRIEKGEVNVSPNELKVLLGHLDVTDPEQVEELLKDARISRRERWTISSDDREHMTPAMIELAQFESDAVAIRYYNNTVIPGALQTQRYAEAVFANSPAMDAGTIAARIAVRQRRRQVLYRPSGPACYVLLDESVLYRVLGSAGVMAEQLDLLLTAMAETKLQVRVIPLVAANSLLFLGPFMLIDLEEGSSALIYREPPGRDEVVQTPSEVKKHRDSFDQIWELALDHAKSVDLIARRAAQLRSEATSEPAENSASA